VRDKIVQKRLGWVKKSWVVEPEDCPRQTDSHNCGPYVLWWAKEIVEGHGADVTTPGDSWRREIMAVLERVPRQGRNDPPTSFSDGDLEILEPFISLDSFLFLFLYLLLMFFW
jgi:hypothetical protein